MTLFQRLQGYKIFRRDRNCFGGGLALYVNEIIPCKILSENDLGNNHELIFLEISLMSRKWLIIGLYKPPTLNEIMFLESLSKILNRLSCRYENMILIGDFNLTVENINLEIFMNTYDLECLIKKPTCYQSTNPKCIDLILTNKKTLFKNSNVIEVGISDHHSFVVTALRSELVKGNPKTKFYRDCKNFELKAFQRELNGKLNENMISKNSNFHNILVNTLNTHAPLKKKVMRFNNNPFMTKTLRKAIMQRSKLKTEYNVKRTIASWEKYKRQRNYCVNLLRKSKKNYFQNLNVKDLADNKKFWKSVKPYFSKKGINSNKILLKENDCLVSNEIEVAQIMNNFFVNITKELDLKDEGDQRNINIYSNLESILENSSNHPSIEKIEQNFDSQELFSFQQVNETEVKDIVLKLNSSKAISNGDIPVNILKETIDINIICLTRIINSSFQSKSFPDWLKSAEVTPIYKKNDDLDKENYRPVSILPVVSKVFERIMYNQIVEFMDDKLSRQLTGFRKNHSTQNCLLSMIDAWKKIIDKNGTVSAIFMDLSKAFDTLNHTLLISKLGAYGFRNDALLYMKSYLSERHQRVRINNTYSAWAKIITGVPQGSILGPLLFNIFVNDLFLFISTSSLSNYADDNTLYNFGFDADKVLETLVIDFETVKDWYFNNYMVLNAGKCHFMCLGKDSVHKYLTFNNIVMENTEEVKILGITIDNKLSFNSHIKTLCVKASQKLGALSRLSNYLNKTQKSLVFNSMIKSHFSYCPLVWMFCSRTSNNRINKLHERSLRVIHTDEISDFDSLLDINNDITIHHRNIQVLMIEVYKIKNGIAPPIMNSILTKRTNTYNLRHFQEFETETKRTVNYGLESFSFRSPQLWASLPEELKEIEELNQFKRKIKKWVCSSCPCRICKIYIPNLGYL